MSRVRDAGRLLHAMTTNHVKELAPGAGLYAFFLNDKGRIVADANIYHLESDFWLDTEPETGPKIHHLLDKYIIADDAAATDETSSWFAVGIEGPNSPGVMARLGLPVPERDLGIISTEWGYVARAAVTGPVGFRVWASDAKRAELWEQLESSVPQAMEDDAKVVRLENGVPRYGEDISERYLVQETQALHGVHFNKGCYLGQEIVERVRSRGQVHRLLTPIRIEGTKLPDVGSKLVLDRTQVGEITSAAYSPAFKEVVGFAYLRTEDVGTEARVVSRGQRSSYEGESRLSCAVRLCFRHAGLVEQAASKRHER